MIIIEFHRNGLIHIYIYILGVTSSCSLPNGLFSIDTLNSQRIQDMRSFLDLDFKHTSDHQGVFEHVVLTML